jgi:dTDP-4-dehydrorhamnose reductase
VEAQRIGARVIQIATDCVFSGSRGNYTESDPHDPLDAYGKTKSLGEVQSPNVLHIRCSIIGPELKRASSLLGWFLKQPPGATLQGFAHHEWNGVTTLQFARLCSSLIRGGTARFDALRNVSSVHHFVPNVAVNKHELLQLFARVFEHPVVIERTDASGPPVRRTLSSNFTLLGADGVFPLEEAIRELKASMETEDYASVLCESQRMKI